MDRFLKGSLAITQEQNYNFKKQILYDHKSTEVLNTSSGSRILQ